LVRKRDQRRHDGGSLSAPGLCPATGSPSPMGEARRGWDRGGGGRVGGGLGGGDCPGGALILDGPSACSPPLIHIGGCPDGSGDAGFASWDIKARRRPLSALRRSSPARLSATLQEQRTIDAASRGETWRDVVLTGSRGHRSLRSARSFSRAVEGVFTPRVGRPVWRIGPWRALGSRTVKSKADLGRGDAQGALGSAVPAAPAFPLRPG
jgi:hypothetical protein